LHRTDKPLEENWAVFEVDMDSTKPEIKQYFEKRKGKIFKGKVYGSKILRVNTSILMGPIKKDMFGSKV
jgi:ribosomal protein L23